MTEETTGKVDTTAAQALAVYILMGLALVFTPLIVGITIATMWNWFLTPLGLETMPSLVGVGVFLVVRLATWKLPIACCAEFNVAFQTLISAVLHNFVAALALAFGWVVLWLS